MDTKNNNNEVTQEAKQNVFNKITPLSKYLAMALFISLPFVGFWLGYRYAPEKIVEVNDATSTTPIYPQEGLLVSEYDLRYSYGGEPFMSGTKDKIFTRGLAGFLYEDSKTVYEYSDESQTYEVLVSDITTVNNFPFLEEGTNFYIQGWSDDRRYVAFTVLPYEGVYYNHLYYLDTENLEEGFIVVEDGFKVASVSPNKNKILGIKEAREIYMPGEKPLRKVKIAYDGLYVFDMNSLEKKLVYANDGDKYTFMSPGFIGDDYLNVVWIDNSQLLITRQTHEDFYKYFLGPVKEKIDEYYGTFLYDVVNL